MDIMTMDLDAIHDEATATALLGCFRKSLGMITGKWKLEILWLLNQRMHRFGELRRALPGITQHMLTVQLRELESDGLVKRTIYAEVPPRVEYKITSAANQIRPVIQAILDWAEQSQPSDAKSGGRKAGKRPKAT